MLKGNSKFQIELIKGSNGYLIKKSSQDNPKRLLNQAMKQHLFHHLIPKNAIIDSYFETPEVLSKGKDYFVMDFYNGKSILDIFEKGDITILDEIVTKLFWFIKWETFKCTKDKVNEILIDKLNSLPTNPIIDNCIDYINKNTIIIPIGLCHGDLTLSNVIFSNKIVLIDFLDSYLESPLQDITKLLQESNLKWSLLMDNSKRDNTKIEISYDYLKSKINQKIEEKFKEYISSIKLIYIITLLRILPYTDDNKISDIINKEIEKTFKEL